MVPGSLILIGVLEIIYVCVQLIVGIFLTYKMKKTKLLNLAPLILYFILKPMELILLLIIQAQIIYDIILFFSNISLVLFTKYTFYKNRKSPFIYILIFLLCLKILHFTMPFSIPLESELDVTYIPYYYVYLSVIALFTLLPYLWFALSSISYYKLIKNHLIEPWIKKRYYITGLSSLIASINGILYLFLPFNTTSFEEPIAFTVGLLLAINFLIFSIGNLLAWVMPKQLKDYFNKNFQPIQEETLTEKELIEKIKFQLTNGKDH